MPLASTISCVPQGWIICLLCSLALAGISFRSTVFYETDTIVKKFTLYKLTPTGGCPYLYSGCQWEKEELPFYLPDVFWNPSILDIALSAYIIGICLTAVPAGLLSDLGYSRYVLGGGMFLVTITTILLPMTAELGTTVYVMSSILDGIGEGTILPSVIALISRWSPPSKRNTFAVLVVAGFYYGTTLGHIFFYLNYRVISSWSFGKYSSGSFGIVWLILWIIFGYHSPAINPFASQHRLTITSCQRPPIVEGLKRLRKLQWKKILTSFPFLSAVLLYCSLNWLVLSNIDDIVQSYQEYILHLPEEFSEGTSIGVIVALPTSLMGGVLTDWVVKHKLISNTNIKKILVITSMILSSVFVVSATFVGCNHILFWILTGIAYYFTGLVDVTIFTIPIDLSPRNSGMLMGIIVSARSVFSLTDPTIDSILTIDPYEPSYWQLTSTFNAIVAFVLVIPFLAFGSAQKQHWNRRSRRPVTYSHTELETPGQPNPIQEP